VVEKTLEWQVKAANAELEGKMKRPYVCPCCKKKDTKEGEHGPTSATTNARLTWQRQHNSQRYTHVSFMHIDPSRRFPDLLHINLRVVTHRYW
jgi:uncharacterized protein (DUF2345 family)